MRDGSDGIEVLLLRRNPDLAFNGGAWVFPGGRVDEGDAVAARTGDHSGLAAARVAASRELTEEAGLVVPAEDMVPWAHWTTPPGPPRRFATWFLVAAEAEVEDVVVDGGEIHAADWLTPAAALARYQAGQITLAAPTWLTLRQIDEHATVAAVLRHAETSAVLVYEPRVCRNEDGTLVSLYEGDAGWPTVDSQVPGARHRLLRHEDGYRFEQQP